MQTSNEVTNIFKAICECKKDFLPLQKNKQGYGYKYVTLDAVIDMLNTVLPKHGLGFVQFPSTNGCDYSLTTRVIHESGEWLEDTITFSLTEISKANDTQKLGASVTYFRRYTLSSIFGIAADEDVDGNVDTAIEMQNNQKKQFNEQQRYQQKQQPVKREQYVRQSEPESVREERQSFLTKEKYNGVYITTDESCNEHIKRLVDETYKGSCVFSEKTKDFLNKKADNGEFKDCVDYIERFKNVSNINKKKIDERLAEEQKQEEPVEKQNAENIEF